MDDARALADAAIARKEWREAARRLRAIAAPSSEDLERLAIALYLTGEDEGSEDAWARACKAARDRGDAVRVARCAFWLGFQLMNKGEMAPAAGWFGRAASAIAELDCVEAGYIELPQALEAMFGGDAPTARDAFERAAVIAERFEDRDLAALVSMGRGQLSINVGDMRGGIALLDAVMVSVTANEVSPVVAGLVYCAVIVACRDCFDLQRAHQWTRALTRWCDAQPDLVPYRGQCMVHRSELMMTSGDWNAALDEVERARADLGARNSPALGDAFYQAGELRRVRGELALAEQEYRNANEAGRSPYPGLSLLRLATGEAAAAFATSKRLLDEASDARTRAVLLPAHVEIALTLGDIAAARAAAVELDELARDNEATFMHAVSAHADGAVLLAEGDARAALRRLRAAWDSFRELGAVYDGARTRVLLGRACRALGDEDGAALEIDAARATFTQLGAAPDLAA
ncbi:MAG: DNA-binding response regulator, partial [Actinobacteria bacterium]|nr:DNA-binding response regulator [Actinomycetota bacterium]